MFTEKISSMTERYVRCSVLTDIEESDGSKLIQRPDSSIWRTYAAENVGLVPSSSGVPGNSLRLLMHTQINAIRAVEFTDYEIESDLEINLEPGGVIALSYLVVDLSTDLSIIHEIAVWDGEELSIRFQLADRQLALEIQNDDGSTEVY